MTVGILLTLGGALASWYLTWTRGFPASVPQVGVATSFYTTPEAGLVLRLVVQTHGCSNPVHVALAIGGTNEVWRLNRKLPPEQAVAVAVGPNPVAQARIDPVAGGALVEARGYRSLLPRGKNFQFDGRADNGGFAVFAADVLRWGRTQETVEAQFDANWISPRSFSSCYLRLPALLGEGIQAPYAAAADELPRLSPHRVRANPDDFFGWVSWGAIDLLTTLDIRSDLSRPAPSDAFTSEWTCTSVFVGRQRQAIGSLGYYLVLPHDSRQCQTIAVLEDSSRVTLTNVLLVLAGAVVALGLTLLVETAVRHRGTGNRA